MTQINYEQTGVKYDLLDAFKRACQQAGKITTPALALHGLVEPEGVRGESAYFLESAEEYLAIVQEGLGTKNLVADAMFKLTGRSFYRNIGIDLVATIVNDLATCGAAPMAAAMFLAAGSSEWFGDEQRGADLAAGFAEGCRQAGAAWGSGETQVLTGIINPEAVVLAGTAIGRIRPKSRRIVGNVQPGDAIIFLASSGVQTNGLTLCRALVERLAQGYLTPIADGRVYGEALLDPSVIYVAFIQACQQAGVQLHYAAHITGHGWRKLMRADVPLVYRIHTIHKPHPVFDTISQTAKLDATEAYGTFNMGVGMAVYVAEGDVQATLAAAKANGYEAWHAGTVEKQGERKSVVIEPLGVVYEGESLQIR